VDRLPELLGESERLRARSATTLTTTELAPSSTSRSRSTRATRWSSGTTATTWPAGSTSGGSGRTPSSAVRLGSG